MWIPYVVVNRKPVYDNQDLYVAKTVSWHTRRLHLMPSLTKIGCRQLQQRTGRPYHTRQGQDDSS